MDLSSHRVERQLEEAFHGVKVAQVALDGFDRPPESSNRIRSLMVGAAWALHEADAGTSLSESNGAGSTDTCGDKRSMRGTKGRALLEWMRLCAESGCMRILQVRGRKHTACSACYEHVLTGEREEVRCGDGGGWVHDEHLLDAVCDDGGGVSDRSDRACGKDGAMAMAWTRGLKCWLWGK